MALFGIELVITLIMLSLLHRLSVYYSFAKWIIAYRLIRYWYSRPEKPDKHSKLDTSNNGAHSDDRNFKNDKSRRNRKRLCGNWKRNDKVVSDSDNQQITLEASLLHPYDFMHLHFYREYQWLVDFAVYAFVVYLMSEIHYALVPSSKEMNLSLIWCFLVIAFATKILSSLTGIYFTSNDEAIGERSLCLISGCLFFLLAMIVLIGNESFVEFGLNDAYYAFNSSATKFIENYGLQNIKGVLSQVVFKFILAVWCGLMGAFLIFPGFRLAQMYIHSLSYAKGNIRKQFILHVAFISPLLTILLWVRPVAREYFTEKSWGKRGILMTADSFEIMRIFVILSTMLIRLAVMPWYLQSYLNLAPRKLARLKKEAGRVKDEEVQKLISGVFVYLFVVCLQYVCPLLQCTFIALLSKTFGGYSWLSLFQRAIVSKESPMLSYIFYRGVLGFMSWWLMIVWFISSIIGFIYHSYLSRDTEILIKK
ncbi:transmembrane protein 161-like emei [Brevipalpus obovatus]|uniref:transmembrane protein 161-like emei n=1 Tax=Brevipalpus obovatus TaxID=246614 RepID=UPI003D9DEA85